MSLDLAALQAKRAKIEIPIDDEEQNLEVEYLPNKYTSATHNRLVAMTKDPSMDPLVDVLTDVVAGWNLETGGKPLPVNRDNIAALPLPILVKIGEQIVEHVGGKNARKN